jgi:hypothetical protein
MNAEKLRANLRERSRILITVSRIGKTGGYSCLGCLSQLLCLVPHLYRFLRSLLRIVWRIAKKGAGAREIIARSNVTRNASNETPRSTHTCQPLLITHPWRGCRVRLQIGRNSMLRPLLITVATGLVMGSAPALAYKMSCEELCRIKICITTNYNFISCMPTCVQKCMIRRSDLARKVTPDNAK